MFSFFFFLNNPPPTEFSPLPLHAALPIYAVDPAPTVTCDHSSGDMFPLGTTSVTCSAKDASGNTSAAQSFTITVVDTTPPVVDRKSTRLNSSHSQISYAVFCLKKKKDHTT